MPIHKEAWMMAGLEYKGHTDLLRQHFDTDAIMMLGVP
ncbi:MAG: 4-hydroxythreonine-4-phosphate dehydrogenase PdxA [Sulfurimonas sp.]|nr:4-hydroxythreonine-4-phosphate dehydrogenase PdxA [Sulfurimonas sp.]